MVAAAVFGPSCQSESVTGAKSDGWVAVGAGVGLGPAGEAVAAGGAGVCDGAGTGVSVGAAVGAAVAWAQAARSSAVTMSARRRAGMGAILPSAPLGLKRDRKLMMG